MLVSLSHKSLLTSREYPRKLIIRSKLSKNTTRNEGFIYEFCRIEAFGGPKEVGEAVVRTITGSRLDVKGTLTESSLREDSLRKVNYYKLEFRVESPAFHRHNLAVCCARAGRLYTLNAQAPESAWPNVKADFYRIADSFSIIS
jgi:hypothetical protein